MFQIKLFDSYYGASKTLDVAMERFAALQLSPIRPPLLCERIVENHHRLYLDFDSKVEVDMAEKIRAVRDGLISEEVEMYEMICTALKGRLTREGVPEVKQRVIGCYKPERIMLKINPTTKAKSKWKKRSLRFYCPDVVVSKATNKDIADELNRIIQHQIVERGWQDCFPESNMDLSIYSANSPMLILGSCKNSSIDPVKLRRMPDADSMAAEETDYLINIVHVPDQHRLEDRVGLGPAAKKQRTAAPSPMAPYSTYSTLTEDVKDAIKEVVARVLKPDVVVDSKPKGDSIIITLNEWYCPQKQRNHSSNRQYAFINSKGLTFKCHDDDCKGEYNHLPLAELPLLIQNLFRPAPAGLPSSAQSAFDDFLSDSDSDSNSDSDEPPANSMFLALNEKVKCDLGRTWALAPSTVFKNTKDKTMWVQPDHYDCFYGEENQTHATKGACGIVTDMAKCTVGVKCPTHGLTQREHWKPILEHVHIGLLHVQMDHNHSVEVKDTDLSTLIESALSLAHQQGLKVDLASGSFQVPVEGKPLVYAQGPEFKAWIRKNLDGDPRLNADNTRCRRLEETFSNACDSRVPELERDMNLIAFQNGILDLQDLHFVLYEDIDVADYGGKAARHYIDGPLDLSNLTTSALDGILDYQLKNRTDASGVPYDAAEIKDWILALFGRLLFPVNSRDKFEIVPVVYGMSGTGKSSLGTMVRAFFAKGRRGTITHTMEEKFGIEALSGKEVMITLETPDNIDKLLPKATFQSLASGESISVAAKHKVANTDFDWDIPMIFFANHMLAYKDAGGMSAARRIAGIMFDRYLPEEQQDDRVKDNLQAELPAALYKCVEAYIRLIVNREDQTKAFWGTCPKYFKDQLVDTVESTNGFLAWLKSGEEVTGIVPSQADWVLWDDVLKPHIERSCPRRLMPPHLSSRMSEFGMMGWHCERKTHCKICGSVGGVRCCGVVKTKRTLMFGCKLV